MTLITCARPSLPRAHSPSFLTTRHARSNTRSTSIFMPSVISWNAASQSSNSSDASRPASKKPPEITWPSSPSLPLSYGYGKCPHHLDRAAYLGIHFDQIQPGIELAEQVGELRLLFRRQRAQQLITQPFPNRLHAVEQLPARGSQGQHLRTAVG